jgi:hypothetical protein
MIGERYGRFTRAVACVFALAGSLPSEAAAECGSDADCGAGFRCATQSVTSCHGPACPPGQTCSPPTCETREYGECVAADCENDSDCPDPMVCHERTSRECEERPVDACPDDGSPCPTPPSEPPDCTERTETKCRYPYELPCAADLDCGPAFRCVEAVESWCTDSASVDGGSSTQECGTRPTGEFACELVDLACQANADCPAGLTCIERPVTIVCDDPAPAAQPRCRAVREEPARVCRPRHGDDGTLEPGSGLPPSGDDGTSPPGDVPPEPEPDAGVEPARDAGATDGGGPRDAGTDSGTRDAGPSDGSVDAAAPTDGGVGDGGPRDGGASDGGASDGGSSNPRDEARERFLRWLERVFGGGGGGGCSLAEAHTQGADLSMLLIAGALLLVRRRRR